MKESSLFWSWFFSKIFFFPNKKSCCVHVYMMFDSVWSLKINFTRKLNFRNFLLRWNNSFCLWWSIPNTSTFPLLLRSCHPSTCPVVCSKIWRWGGREKGDGNVWLLCLTRRQWDSILKAVMKIFLVWTFKNEQIKRFACCSVSALLTLSPPRDCP